MHNAVMSKTVAALLVSALPMMIAPTLAGAAWKPTQPIEFVVTAGAGGGTDNFARTVQGIITKHKLADASIVVLNKGGGSGAEGYLYGKAGDAHRLTFGTNNEYLLPMIAKLAWQRDDFTPVAAMALDEFMLWVKADAPYKDAKAFIDAAKAKPDTVKMGGSQAKDTDQTLTTLITGATGAKFLYVPFKSGGQAAVQLAGGHIDANTDNPSESLGQWKAGMVRPLCVFAPKPLAAGPKVTATQSWSDVPACKASGIPIDQYQQPRAVYLPKGVPADAVAYYVDLMSKVRATPEWKTYIEHSAQTDQFLTGTELSSFIADNEKSSRKVFEQEGWLIH